MIIRESRIHCLARQLLIFDVGTLLYPVIGIKQHAVQSVTGTVNGLVNPTHVQRSITWTGFNMPLKISKGNSIMARSQPLDFLYGVALGHEADHARVYEMRKTGATVRLIEQHVDGHGGVNNHDYGSFRRLYGALRLTFSY